MCIRVDFKKRIEGIFHILDRKTRLDEKVKKTDKKGPSSTMTKSGEHPTLSSGSSSVGKDKCDHDDDNNKENLSSSSSNQLHQNGHKSSKKQKGKQQQEFSAVFEVQDPVQHMRHIMQLLTNE